MCVYFWMGDAFCSWKLVLRIWGLEQNSFLPRGFMVTSIMCLRIQNSGSLYTIITAWDFWTHFGDVNLGYKFTGVLTCIYNFSGMPSNKPCQPAHLGTKGKKFVFLWGVGNRLMSRELLLSKHRFLEFGFLFGNGFHIRPYKIGKCWSFISLRSSSSSEKSNPSEKKIVSVFYFLFWVLTVNIFRPFNSLLSCCSLILLRFLKCILFKHFERVFQGFLAFKIT